VLAIPELCVYPSGALFVPFLNTALFVFFFKKSPVLPALLFFTFRFFADHYWHVLSLGEDGEELQREAG